MYQRYIVEKKYKCDEIRLIYNDVTKFDSHYGI